MANMYVLDPISPVNKTNPTERDNKTIPLEVIWERQFEQEKSLNDKKSEAVAETQRFFSSTGSMLNEFKPEIQVEDRQVKSSEFNSDMWMDMFKKPLENATNIAGTLINEAPNIFDAAKDLGQMLVGAESKSETPMTKEKVKEAEEKQWQSFTTQKTGELNAVISQIAMQRKMAEALYIVGEPISQDAAEVLVSNTSMDAQNLNTKDKHIWMAKKRSDNIKAAKKADIHKDTAEVQTPEIVADLEGGVEGGTGRGSHIMSQAGGGE